MGIITNNLVTISGEIVSEFEFSHEVKGEKFYTAKLSSVRNSGIADVLTIMVSERLVSVKEEWTGRYAKIIGQIRSYNEHADGRARCILSIFAREFEEMEALPFMDFDNNVSFDGFICKPPVYRETPLGREICDIILAVNRAYGKSDYIPCITWGRNAVYASGLEVGTHISLEGRFQSREYKKRISDEEYETRTAYEVSANTIEVIWETEDIINENSN